MPMRHVPQFLNAPAQAFLGGLSWALMAVGAVLAGYGMLWQLGLAPGSRVVIPAPLALQVTSERRAVLANPASTTAVDPLAAGVVFADVPGSSAPVGSPSTFSAQLVDGEYGAGPPAAAPVEPAAAAPIALAELVAPGYAARVSIPSVGIDTEVRQGGIRKNLQGEWEWETRPFVAVHYGDLTALVGARGNAVIAGHVATLYEGNVFWSLYRVGLGDRVEVQDDEGTAHVFQVAEVRLVAPDDISVMKPTDDPVLTLITCGGEFDPVRREFSARLVVVATPVDPAA